VAETPRAANLHDPDAFLRALAERYPGLRVIDKERDAFSRAIDWALRIVTVGGQRHYLTRYVTTIGRRLYLPRDWAERDPRSRYLTLRHEAVHLAQFARWGLVPTALLYLLPIVPLGLAWGRARLEWEAYAETFRATAEVFGLEAARDPALRAHVVRQFVSSAYGWMWPFPRQVEGWIDELLAGIEASGAPPAT